MCLKVANEKGASSWVSESHDHATVLSKADFIDAVYIRLDAARYDECVCGATFDVQHALNCMRGGYRTIQHNEVRDVLANVLKEAGFKAVETEPQLHSLTGETFELKSANKDDDARSDIKCNGFWRPMRMAYFDIKVLSPYANSYVSMPSASLYRMAEQTKNREYGEQSRACGFQPPCVYHCRWHGPTVSSSDQENSCYLK